MNDDLLTLSRPGNPSLPAAGRLPLSLLARLGERLAADAVALQRHAGDAADVTERAGRLEALGLQCQELAQIISRAGQLRTERVDLGLALLQTLAEWSPAAARLGAELHGPVDSVQVRANPAALKHLLDLLLEHALLQGRAVRLSVDDDAAAPMPCLVVQIDSAPATVAAPGDTLPWLLLTVLARALSLLPERRPVAGGERIVLALPRAT